MLLMYGGEKLSVEPEYFHIQLGEFRIYFNQTRVGECWNSGKSKSGSFILFLLSLNVFYDALYVFYRF